MPIYEFRCMVTMEIKEVILPLSECDEPSLICPVHCTPDSPDFNNVLIHSAERIWSAPAKLEHGKPTIILKNKRTGELRTVPHSRAMIPRGFEPIELKNSIERSKAEKVLGQQENAVFAIEKMKIQSQIEETTKNRHKDIKAGFDKVHTDYNMDPHTGKVDYNNPVKFEYDTQTKVLLDEAINRKKKTKLPVNPEFNFTVNNYDKSNLDKDLK